MMNVELIAAAAVILLAVIAVKVFFGKFKREETLRPLPNSAQEDVCGKSELLCNKGVRLRASVSSQSRSTSEDESLQMRDQIVEVSHGTRSTAKKEATQFEANAEKKAHRTADEQTRANRNIKEERTVEENKEKECKDWLQNVNSYIKDHKIVTVTELANKFEMKTSTAMDTIEELQRNHSLSGAMDSCGRFVYVSPEHMTAVTNFIKQKGRVTIDDLTEVSTKLINFNSVNKNL